MKLRKTCPSWNSMKGSHVSHAGFTLMEIMATLLLITIGLGSVAGMATYGLRLSSEFQSDASALATAETVIVDHEPGWLIADSGDANGDGWSGDDGSGNAFPTNLASPYSFSVEGRLNGYYIYRFEESTLNDAIDNEHRWATVTVHIYMGDSDEYVTSLRRRVLRPLREVGERL